MSPGLPKKLVKVNVSDILPKKSVSIREQREIEFNNTISDEMNRAGNRFVKVVVEPQKNIIRNAMYDSLDGTIDPVEISDRIDKMYDDVTDLRANIGNRFDVQQALMMAHEGIESKENLKYVKFTIDDFVELEMLKDKGLYEDAAIETNPTRKVREIDIASLVDDEDYTEPVKQPIITQPKATEVEDSYAIDPSLFDD